MNSVLFSVLLLFYGIRICSKCRLLMLTQSCVVCRGNKKVISMKFLGNYSLGKEKKVAK